MEMKVFPEKIELRLKKFTHFLESFCHFATMSLSLSYNKNLFRRINQYDIKGLTSNRISSFVPTEDD